MKRFFLIITLITAAMNVAAQSDTIVVKESKYDYIGWVHGVENDIREAPKYVWRIDVFNNSDENYLTWLNMSDNEDGYGDINQIIGFFYWKYPSLFYSWNYREDMDIVIGKTFLKVIGPKESFSYFIIKNSNGEPKIKKQISIAKETVVTEKALYPDLVTKCHSKRYFFKEDSIILTEE